MQKGELHSGAEHFETHQSAMYTLTSFSSRHSLTALQVSTLSSTKCTFALLSFTNGFSQMVLQTAGTLTKLPQWVGRRARPHLRASIFFSLGGIAAAYILQPGGLSP